MTIMHMIVTGAIPEDDILMSLDKAEENIDACLRIAPEERDYLNAQREIREFKKRHSM